MEFPSVAEGDLFAIQTLVEYVQRLSMKAAEDIERAKKLIRDGDCLPSTKCAAYSIILTGKIVCNAAIKAAAEAENGDFDEVKTYCLIAYRIARDM